MRRCKSPAALRTNYASRIVTGLQAAEHPTRGRLPPVRRACSRSQQRISLVATLPAHRDTTTQCYSQLHTAAVRMTRRCYACHSASLQCSSQTLRVSDSDLTSTPSNFYVQRAGSRNTSTFHQLFYRLIALPLRLDPRTHSRHCTIIAITSGSYGYLNWAFFPWESGGYSRSRHCMVTSGLGCLSPILRVALVQLEHWLRRHQKETLRCRYPRDGWGRGSPKQFLHRTAFPWRGNMTIDEHE